MVRLAILGCGAITQIQHLPTAVEAPGIQLMALVDANVNRAQALRDSYGIRCQLATDYHQVLAAVDAVINALPNHLHASVNMAAIEAGVAVLCEKPLAMRLDDARACCEAAERKGVVLAVSMPRRFFPATHLVGQVLQAGTLGSPLVYDWEHGMPFGWPAASGFYFSRDQAGGGVTLDEGIHLLGVLLDWFGPVRELNYRDDNWGGGIEANAVLQMIHFGAFGEVRGRLRLSRTYTLKNRLLISGPEARLELLRSDPGSVALVRSLAGGEVRMTIRRAEAEGPGGSQPFRSQLSDFVRAVETRSKPAVDGWHGLQSLELIQKGYAEAGRLPEPWFEEAGMKFGIAV